MDNRKNIIAAACHSAWYAYTVIALGEEGEPYDKAPKWQLESIYDAIDFWDSVAWGPHSMPAEALRKKLPELSHENWCEHKKSHGWTYGPTKDPEAKTHPCLVPYGDLPEEQKAKDLVVVEAYLAMRSIWE